MDLLTLLIIILIVMWVGGFALSLGGSAIHALLVIALIVLVYRLMTGRRV